MDDYPVKVGSMLFTLVDPHRGYEVAYNRWYERDHFYAGCMIGPGMLSGGRWVAPRRLKDLRFPETSPFAEPADAGSYLSIYWVHAGQEDEWQAWGRKQVWSLYGNGRGFDERTHAHTAIYDYRSTAYANDDGVPIELALDHHFAGLAVLSLEPAQGTGPDELAAWVEGEVAPELLAEAGGVASVSSWTVRQGQPADGAPMSLGASGGTPERLVQLCFLDTEPAGLWERFRRYAAAVDAGGHGRVTFAAPFVPTVVGTDTYADELW
ncbi:MAG TPA: hypothetical protein VE575_10510 [Acidimicrobiales bacterium]|nr:hypothetical protein [Acidimicrobiales bacterium]